MTEARQPSNSGSEAFVAIVGKDEWRRYKGCVVVGGHTLPCEHFHKTADQARSCAERRIEQGRKRMERLMAVRTKAPDA